MLKPFPLPDWPPRWPEIDAALLAAIRSGQWGSYRSTTCQLLEKELAKQFQADHVRLCCSGSAAIEIALRAAGVGSGDEVIVSAYDYPGNLRTVELLGAKPVLIDIGHDSLGPDCEQLDLAAGKHVRAVIASHLFGVAADIAEIRQMCDQRRWILIEDACQVPGMSIGEKPAGSFGHFAALSFGGSKPVSSGSGGALLTSEPKLAARLGPLLDRPSDVMPLSPLQAAVVRPQLDRLAELNRQRFETVRFLQSQVVPQLPAWRWLSRWNSDVHPAYYKVAWAAKSESHRRQIVIEAAKLGLPIGEGFHDMSRSSERRCRKPVPLARAAKFGETLFVLDHRALLIDRQQHSQLGDYLINLHENTNAHIGE